MVRGKAKKITVYLPGDLRKIFKDSKNEGITVYEALVKAKVIKSLSEDFPTEGLR